MSSPNIFIQSSDSLSTFFNIIRSIIGIRVYVLVFISFLSTLLESFAITFIIPLINKLADSDSNYIDQLDFDNKYLNILIEWLSLLDLNKILIYLMIIFVLRSLLLILANSYRIHLKFYLLANIKKRLIKKYFSLNLQASQVEDSGYYNNLISEQSMMFAKGFDIFLRLVMKVIQSIIFIGLALFISFKLNLLVIFSSLIVILLFRQLNNVISKYSEKYTKEATKLSSLITQSVQSYEYLKITNQEKNINNQSFILIKNISKYLRNMGILNLSVGFLIEPIILFILISFFILGSTIFAMQQMIILLSFMFLFRGISHLLGIQQKILGFLTFVGPVNEIHNQLKNSNDDFINNDEDPIEFFKENIELKNVSFSYNKVKNVLLKNISLKINKNEFIGIVGQSGSGKSTLAKIISLVLFPSTGNILIDGKVFNNKSKTHLWRSNIGFLSQKLYLYKETILKNITMDFKNNEISIVNIEKINNLCKRLNLYSFIQTLPDKYNEEVSEMGGNLSTGQIQRLLIVRELYRDPGILIFDEPTSALDRDNQKNLISIINQLKGEYTIIVISHDFEILQNADKLFEIKDSKLSPKNEL